MADGFFQLGEALLGGGIDREGARLEGLNAGSQINLRNAQTKNALAQARQRVQQAEATEQLGDALEAAGMDRELAPLLAGGFGSDFKDVTGGLETQQGMDFRDVLADPNLPAAERQGAGLALRGTPITQGDVFGPGGEQTLPDLFSGVFEPNVTATGRAQIGADEALGQQRIAAAALSDKKRTNPELFRSGGTTVNLNTPLAEQILPGLEGTSIVPGDINAEEGFGAESFFKQGVNAITDFVGFGTPFPDTAVANNVLSELSARTQIAMRADVPGARPPVIVQELLGRYAEDPMQLFRGDDIGRQNLHTTLMSLKRTKQRIIDQLNSPTKKTPTRMGDLEQNLLNVSDTVADYEAIERSLNEKLGPLKAGGAAPTQTGGGLPPGWTVEPVGN